MKKMRILLIAIMTFALLPAEAQKKDTRTSTKTEEGYSFTPVSDLPATSVKDQARTGTCWCFATTSFIESELLRKGKGEYDLSEMFIVRYNYINRLKDNYLRQGKGNLGEGSLAHDFMKVFSEEGIVPDEIFNGLNYGSATHNHSELQSYINAVAAIPVQKKKESDEYYEIVNGILDSYLGKVPETFTYKGVSYTPESFSASLDINPSDYVEITSFKHFPFYSLGVLEVPDNWAMEKYYNVPLDELVEIMDYSFEQGLTVNWDGDVSERGFSRPKGVAINPLLTIPDELPAAAKSNQPAVPDDNPFSFVKPVPEVNVTQDIRQLGYENFTTTDDHLMHLTGVVKDQNGTKYYKTKNSWGMDNSPYQGYWYMSESYVRAKTIYIMVHKDGIPKEIRARLGL